MTHVAEMLRTYPAGLGDVDRAALARCIDECLDCSQACMTACRSCGDERERHARMHEHCRACAQACRHCEQACPELTSALG